MVNYIGLVINYIICCSFMNGGGEAHSHMAEGLSTILQVFDDLKDARDSRY